MERLDDMTNGEWLVRSGLEFSGLKVCPKENHAYDIYYNINDWYLGTVLYASNVREALCEWLDGDYKKETPELMAKFENESYRRGVEDMAKQVEIAIASFLEIKSNEVTQACHKHDLKIEADDLWHNVWKRKRELIEQEGMNEDDDIDE